MSRIVTRPIYTHAAPRNALLIRGNFYVNTLLNFFPIHEIRTIHIFPRSVPRNRALVFTITVFCTLYAFAISPLEALALVIFPFVGLYVVANNPEFYWKRTVDAVPGWVATILCYLRYIVTKISEFPIFRRTQDFRVPHVSFNSYDDEVLLLVLRYGAGLICSWLYGVELMVGASLPAVVLLMFAVVLALTFFKLLDTFVPCGGWRGAIVEMLVVWGLVASSISASCFIGLFPFLMLLAAAAAPFLGYFASNKYE